MSRLALKYISLGLESGGRGEKPNSNLFDGIEYFLCCLCFSLVNDGDNAEKGDFCLLENLVDVPLGFTYAAFSTTKFEPGLSSS